jgi:hypothetical protein
MLEQWEAQAGRVAGAVDNRKKNILNDCIQEAALFQRVLPLLVFPYLPGSFISQIDCMKPSHYQINFGRILIQGYTNGINVI